MKKNNNKFERLYISEQMENTFRVAPGNYTTPAKDFEISLPNTDLTLTFHNTGVNRAYDGEIEVNKFGKSVAFADVKMSQEGKTVIKNLYINPIYEIDEDLNDIVNFINRAMYASACIACARNIKKAQNKIHKRQQQRVAVH